MIDHAEVWCETDTMGMNEINRRARLAYERQGVATLIFLSADLYSKMNKSLGGSSNIVRFISSVGELHLQVVQRFRNLCFVGTKEDFNTWVSEGVDPIFWNDQERLRIDQAFEDLLILEGKK